MEEGAGEKEMASSVNVVKDTLVNAVKTVKNYEFISCIKYSKLSYCRMLNSTKFCLYDVDVALDRNAYLPSFCQIMVSCFCTAFFQAFTASCFGDVSETNGPEGPESPWTT